MGIVRVDGSEVINLKGFNINGEILLSDSDKVGDYEKVDVLLPKDYLDFLIEDRGLLKSKDSEISELIKENEKLKKENEDFRKKLFNLTIKEL